MQFNYFRIVVVLLASFCPFFAYICRLNLSMTIDRMVVDEDCQLKNSSISGELIQLCTRNESDGKRAAISMRTEEHALAWLSSVKRQYSYSPLIDNQNINSSQRAKSRSFPNSDSKISTLAIEFDANPNKTAIKQDPDWTITYPRVVAHRTDDEREPPNLLNWTSDARNDLLGAFFIGYLILQIPGARAAEILGPKPIFIFTALGSGLCSLVFPMVAKSSDGVLYPYLLRVLLGATQGAMFPACYVLLCEWLPESERSSWLPVPSANGRLGTIAMNFVVPFIMANYEWEMVFYVSGACVLVWCVLFVLIGSNSPNESHWISDSELMYIESRKEPKIGTVQQQELTASGFEINQQPPAKPDVSWLKMLINRPMMILTFVMFASEWSNMLLLVKLPGFLGPVLGMDIKEIGYWSSSLIAVFCIQYPLSGFLASKLEGANLKWLSGLRVRKLFEVLAAILQGSGCLMIAFSYQKAVVLSALFLIMLGRATVGGGQCLIPPELSKDYPGTAFAFANTLANTAGFIGPMTINWLVDDPKIHESWFSMWIFSATIFFKAGLIFYLYGENEAQDYACKPKAGSKPQRALSQAQLTFDKSRPQVEEIFKMDAFARVASDPNPKLGKELRGPIN